MYLNNVTAAMLDIARSSACDTMIVFVQQRQTMLVISLDFGIPELSQF
jgi:hypothetical protein